MQLLPLGFQASLTSRKVPKGEGEACFESFGQGMAQDMISGTEGTENRQMLVVAPALPMSAV